MDTDQFFFSRVDATGLEGLESYIYGACDDEHPLHLPCTCKRKDKFTRLAIHLYSVILFTRTVQRATNIFIFKNKYKQKQSDDDD